MYFHVLGAIFKKHAALVPQTEYEVKKDEMMSMLHDAGLLDREPINATQVQLMIKDSFRIQTEGYLYPEMLEILLTVTLAFPFSEERLETSRESLKMIHILEKMKIYYVTDSEAFKKEIEDVRKQKNYVPQLLVQEQENVNTSHREAEPSEEKASEDEKDNSDEDNEDNDPAELA